jgi:hypothetical protein
MMTGRIGHRVLPISVGRLREGSVGSEDSATMLDLTLVRQGVTTGKQVTRDTPAPPSD